MELLTFLWEQYLYIPLFNLLIWLYLNYAWFNLGLAIIILTLIIRIILLPFSILTEKGKIVSQRLRREINEIKKDYANDLVQQKIAIRKLLRKKKIRPWARAVVLGVQALVLLLLYQVFLGGINTVQKIHLLYPGIPRPDFINTKFLWFDITQPNLVLAAIVAGYIFAEIMIDNLNNRNDLNKKKHIFSILFPGFVFLILAFLPSAKSIFVLTTLIFSSIISTITAIIKIGLKKAPEEKNPKPVK